MGSVDEVVNAARALVDAPGWDRLGGLAEALAAYDRDQVPVPTEFAGVADYVHTDDDVCSTGGTHLVGRDGLCARCGEVVPA